MMRIIRDFNDYYDSSAGYGVNMSIVYHRVSQTLLKRKGEPEPELVRDVRKLIDRYNDQATPLRSDIYEPFYVGFCGRLYMGLYAYVDQATGKPMTHYSASANKESARPEFYWYQKDFDDKTLKATLDPRPYWRFVVPKIVSLEDWFKANRGAEPFEVLDIFTAHKLVSFCVVGGIDRGVQVNPCLKDLRFQKVIDSFTAFQEISMFISGVLGQTENPMITTSDEDLAVSKGFTDRSFRKEPTKRRRAL
ncbi:hypothetical protein [Pseudomonas sp. JZ134]|uniref:hypothetical protein n=1 Tax=Pseudomonas sp. JZ134 TaxID=2806615 RepID=UPI003DA0F803